MRGGRTPGSGTVRRHETAPSAPDAACGLLPRSGRRPVPALVGRHGLGGATATVARRGPCRARARASCRRPTLHPVDVELASRRAFPTGHSAEDLVVVETTGYALKTSQPASAGDLGSPGVRGSVAAEVRRHAVRTSLDDVDARPLAPSSRASRWVSAQVSVGNFTPVFAWQRYPLGTFRRYCCQNMTVHVTEGNRSARSAERMECVEVDLRWRLQPLAVVRHCQERLDARNAG